MEQGEITRLYGSWLPRTPAHVAGLLEGYTGAWWIAGGWSLEALCAVSRPHGDIDVGIPRREAGLLHSFLDGDYDVWAADHGTLRPLITDDDDDEGSSLAQIGPRCSNLWLRRGEDEPWEYDILLTDIVGDFTAADARWVYKRDHRITAAIGEILQKHQGVRYLRPEIQLLHKAHGLREKDAADFAACLPRLDATQRTWLRDALETAHPGYPWIRALNGHTDHRP